MVIVSFDPAANRVSETFLRTDVGEQAGTERSAEELVEDFNRVVVRIVARNAEVHHHHHARGYVTLLGEVDTRFRPVKGKLQSQGRWTFLPGIERLVQFGFHCARVEITGDSQNDVVGMNKPVDASSRDRSA